MDQSTKWLPALFLSPANTFYGLDLVKNFYIPLWSRAHVCMYAVYKKLQVGRLTTVHLCIMSNDVKQMALVEQIVKVA